MKQIIPFHKEVIFRTMIGEITSISLEHTLKFTDDHNISGDFIVSGSYKMTEASQIEEDFDYHLPVEIAVDDYYDTKNTKIEIDDFYYEIVNDEILKVNIDVLLDGIEKELNREPLSNDFISLDEEVIKSHIEKENKEEHLVRESIENEPINNEDDLQNSELITNVEKTKETSKFVPKIEESKKDEGSRNDMGEEMIDNEIPILQAKLPDDSITNQDNISKEDNFSPQMAEKKEKVIEVNPKEVVTPSIDSIFSAFKDTEETFSTYSVYIVRDNDTLEQIMDKYGCNREELANYNNLDEITIGTKLIIPSAIKDNV